jgi:diaminopimelate epimerase
MRIFNVDGSEAEMCGNGIRCFAKYLYDRRLTRKKDLTVETGAGLIRPHLIARNGAVSSVKVNLGEPRLSSKEIPITGPLRPRVLGEKLTVMDSEYRTTCVSMGNPHCVIFWENLDNLLIEILGPAIECHEAFPRRTNVEFVQVISPTRLRMRVWERGVGETLACGTGAAATLVAAVLNGKASRRAVIQLSGGNLQVEWNEKTNHVFITGPAKEVYRGKVE